MTRRRTTRSSSSRASIQRPSNAAQRRCESWTRRRTENSRWSSRRSRKGLGKSSCRSLFAPPMLLQLHRRDGAIAGADTSTASCSGASAGSWCTPPLPSRSERPGGSGMMHRPLAGGARRRGGAEDNVASRRVRATNRAVRRTSAQDSATSTQDSATSAQDLASFSRLSHIRPEPGPHLHRDSAISTSAHNLGHICTGTCRRYKSQLQRQLDGARIRSPSDYSNTDYRYAEMK